ncbi:MAG: DNRLRE domain-containing protein, partial [Cystobacter sp.]
VAVVTNCGGDDIGRPGAGEEAPLATREEALASTASFAAAADGSTHQDAPGVSFGNADTLSVDRSPWRRGFLRFTVQGLSGTVTRATLRLYVTDGTGDGPRLYPTYDRSWQETDLTWNTAPSFDSWRALDDKGALSQGTWAEYDVSQAVHGNGEFSFALEASSSDGVGFASRENARVDRRPQLVVTVDPAARCEPRVYEQTLLETANADTYVSEAQPAQRFGTEPVLRVDTSPTRLETHLLFPYSESYRTDVWHVKQATVQLFATNGSTQGPRLSATQGSWPWPSLDFDWNTRPTAVGAPVTPAWSVAANAWMNYDVTSVVTGERGAYSFALLPTSDDGVAFTSSDSAIDAQHPRLRVSLASDAYCLSRGSGGGTRSARHYGGVGDERLLALGADPRGGFVAAGRFGDAPFPGEYGFALARYSADGAPVWTRQVTSANVDARALTVTPEGNILVVGVYEGSPDVGAGPLPPAPQNSWNKATFIAKFSPTGQPVWSHGFVATSTYNPEQELQYWPIQPAAVATDAQGSLVVVGNFHGDVNFGGGVLTAGNASVYGEDPFPGSFVAKFNWRGEHVWSRATTAAPSFPWAQTRTVSTDAAGHVFVGGRANHGADLGDGQPLVGSAAYVAKYDGAGALLWKRLFQGSTPVYGEIIGIQPLGNGDVAFAANLGGTFTFAARTYIGGELDDQGYPGNLNGFLGTLSAAGADKTLRDFKSTWLRGVGAASDGGYTVAGYGTNVDLGGGVVGPSHRLTTAAFVARYTASGTHVWSRALDEAFAGERYNPKLLLTSWSDGSVLLGADFTRPFQQEGTTYTPRGAADLFYLRLNP